MTNITKTDIYGCYTFELSRFKDGRGFFEPFYEASILKNNGLWFKVHHINHVCSRTVGTIRGLHYQIAPMHQIKMVTCVDGSVLDVVVDLRPESPTYKKAIGVPLMENKAIYVPAGCAHGTEALQDNSHVLYATSNIYSPAAERILSWKYFKDWHCTTPTLSDKDKHALDFDEEYHTRYLIGLCGS